MHVVHASPDSAAGTRTVAATLPEHVLGGTGRSLRVLGLDARALARSSRAAAVAVLQAGFAGGIDFVQAGPPASELHVAAAHAGDPGRCFIATGTPERSCEGALRGLDRSLRRLGVGQLDLWQVLDLQRLDQLDVISRRDGALAALVRAREEKLVRFIGLGGDSDPAVLLEAMRRFDFDTLLVPLRPGDRSFTAFRDQVLPQARRRGMGVIACPGASGIAGVACARYLLSYMLALAADVVALPCTTAVEVETQLHAAAEAHPFSRAELARIDALLTGE
jgi:aryl-alcohol dehydrogenase-like predicted oxidoreductase